MIHSLADDRAYVVISKRIEYTFPFAPALDQLVALEDRQLVGDGRLRHLQRLSQIADTHLGLQKHKQDPDPG